MKRQFQQRDREDGKRFSGKQEIIVEEQAAVTGR